MKPKRKVGPYLVAFVSYHPISYHVSFFRAVHDCKDLSEIVLFLDDFGVAPTFEHDFQGFVKWDDNILKGYQWKFFKNYAHREKGPPEGPFGCINPGIFFYVLFSNIDAVVVDYANISAWLVYIAARIKKIPILLRGESDLVKKRSGSVWTKLKDMALPILVSNANAVLYSCKRNKEYFLKYGARPESMFPILSSADVSQFERIIYQRDEIRAAMRTRYAIPTNAFVIVFSGRLVSRKRPVDLLKAAIELGSQRDIWVVFVGDGPLRAEIEKLAGASDNVNVVITGFQTGEKLAQHYLMGDAFVMPSEWDPTPKALNEAISSGLPVIVSDGVGQAGDLIIDHMSGLIYEVGDILGLRDKIIALMNDSNFRSILSQEATKMSKEWTSESNAQGVLAAMKHIYNSND